ncbi:MAG: prepilin-type N-terminal cleavage/methylation domain-containing protein [Candidatus Anammoximicrobium sp.]|nr:prepilin-type N-terminal cleavage/methylation domain-containing protein [Candidatus Anammoximicrobium sp.]
MTAQPSSFRARILAGWDCVPARPERSRRCPNLLFRRSGLSLLEVILAVAILGGCLAVTGELVRLGVRNAEEARELTRAQLLCEGKMEEIAAGVAAVESASMVPFETDPDWTYTVDVSPLDAQQLTLVRVTVQQLDSERSYPLTFTLSRWILNPASTTGETSTPTTTEGQTATSGASSDASN